MPITDIELAARLYNAFLGDDSAAPGSGAHVVRWKRVYLEACRIKEDAMIEMVRLGEEQDHMEADSGGPADD